MFDHVGLYVKNFNKSKVFYEKALKLLGFGMIKEIPADVSGSVDFAAFGLDEGPDFWIGSGAKTKAPVHIAFAAKSREHVDMFHQAAVKAGGVDNGKPGVRTNYHPNYYRNL